MWMLTQYKYQNKYTSISNIKSFSAQKIRTIFIGQVYKLLLSFTIISDVYRSFIPNKTTFTK